MNEAETAMCPGSSTEHMQRQGLNWVSENHTVHPICLRLIYMYIYGISFPFPLWIFERQTAAPKKIMEKMSRLHIWLS